MSNYPDDFPHHLLDNDEVPVKENTCEHEDFDIDSEEAHVDGIMFVTYYCNDCGAKGTVTHKISLIEWVDAED